MIVDQAEKLRLLMRRTRKTAQIYTITSGKGGVGKSSIAINLAICLRASGKSVILLDADLGLANLDVLMNVRPRYTLEHVISGRCRLEQIIQNGPGGVGLICGASGLTELADLSEFKRQSLLQQLGALEQKNDILIIDTGAGISSNVLAFCEAAHKTLVVTTPEPAAITDAYAMVKRLIQGHSGTRISVLVNKTESRDKAKRIYQRISQTTSQFLSAAISDGGYILYDPRLAEAVSQCQPLVLVHPRSPASYCFLSLAGKMARTLTADEPRQGFFQKVANWFM